LKSFLKGSDIKEYKNVSIEWKAGEEAHMIIYEDGTQVDTVHLYDMKSKEEIHKLMMDKGFKRTSKDTTENEESEGKIEGADETTNQQKEDNTNLGRTFVSPNLVNEDTTITSIVRQEQSFKASPKEEHSLDDSLNYAYKLHFILFLSIAIMCIWCRKKKRRLKSRK